MIFLVSQRVSSFFFLFFVTLNSIHEEEIDGHSSLQTAAKAPARLSLLKTKDSLKL